MKVAVLVYEYPPKIVGGLGTYSAEITRQFVLMDNDVTVFTMNDDANGLPTREIWRGIEIHRPLHIDISDSLPDIVAEDIKKWGSGIQWFSKTLVYNYLSAAKLVNESIEKGRTLGKGSVTVSNIELHAARAADLIVTVSYAMKDELIGLGCQKEKIQVASNGVDPKKYDPATVTSEQIKKVRAMYDIKDDDHMILFIGRLVGVKGVDKLIMALPHILPKNPKAKLVIVGLGDSQEYLMNLVKVTKMSDFVKFRFEFIPEEERILHYAACQ